MQSCRGQLCVSYGTQPECIQRLRASKSYFDRAQEDASTASSSKPVAADDHQKSKNSQFVFRFDIVRRDIT